MSDWSVLARGLSDALALGTPPVAIAFHDEPPAGVDAGRPALRLRAGYFLADS